MYRDSIALDAASNQHIGTMAYERGDWGKTARLVEKTKINHGCWPLLYEQAIEIAQVQLTD